MDIMEQFETRKRILTDHANDARKDFVSDLRKIAKLYESMAKAVEEQRQSPQTAFQFVTGNVVDNLARQLLYVNEKQTKAEELSAAIEMMKAYAAADEGKDIDASMMANAE